MEPLPDLSPDAVAVLIAYSELRHEDAKEYTKVQQQTQLTEHDLVAANEELKLAVPPVMAWTELDSEDGTRSWLIGVTNWGHQVAHHYKLTQGTVPPDELDFPSTVLLASIAHQVSSVHPQNEPFDASYLGDQSHMTGDQIEQARKTLMNSEPAYVETRDGGMWASPTLRGWTYIRRHKQNWDQSSNPGE